jgi:hypothetical protein
MHDNNHIFEQLADHAESCNDVMHGADPNVLIAAVVSLLHTATIIGYTVHVLARWGCFILKFCELDLARCCAAEL